MPRDSDAIGRGHLPPAISSVRTREWKITREQWEAIKSEAEKCQRAWGMGFPVISIALLAMILKDEPVSESDIPRRPSEYLGEP